MTKLIIGVGILFANLAHANLVIQCHRAQGALTASESAGTWSLSDSCDSSLSHQKVETVYKSMDTLVMEVSTENKQRYSFFGLRDCGRYDYDMEVISLTIFRLNLRGASELSRSMRCTCVKN